MRPEGIALIVLAEDDEAGRDMLVRRLERRGYAVRAAANGRQALDLIRHEPPDLVLLDMEMPVMDGWQAIREIRQDERLRSLPVLGLSAHAMTGSRERALAAGADDYDTKPVEIGRLVGKIEALVRRGGNAE